MTGHACRPLRHLRGEQGYATVTSAGIIAAVVSLMLVVAGLAAHVADSHRARNAADLAAVAAATALYSGSDPCRAARDTAKSNGAEVANCAEDSSDVVVEVNLGRARATARAGPL